VIAASNADLPAKILEASFRQDLYFRLARYIVEMLKRTLEDSRAPSQPGMARLPRLGRSLALPSTQPRTNVLHVLQNHTATTLELSGFVIESAEHSH
jgi:hypothetical protein